MEREVIFAEDVERIFGKRPWASRSEEILSPEPDNGSGAENASLTNDKDADNVNTTLTV